MSRQTTTENNHRITMLEIKVKGLKAKVARCTTAIDGYRVVYNNLRGSFKALQKAETAYFAINSHQPPNSEERVKYATMLHTIELEMRVTKIRKDNLHGERGKTIKALVELESV
jgi:hypothetical protein|tara:strand:- start:852 stop:1193 length:342 start_codon:yes stop_codon:yes gene_type:complete